MVQKHMSKLFIFLKACSMGISKDCTADEIAQGFKGVPTYQVSNDDELNIVELLTTSKIEASKRQAREDIQNGAIYVNGERQQELNYVINERRPYRRQICCYSPWEEKIFLVDILASC